MTVDASRWRRLAVLVTAAAIVIGVGGWLREYVRFGTSIASAQARVERRVRAQFASIVSATEQSAIDLATAPSLVDALTGDRTALGRLFDRARAAVGEADEPAALTVYDSSGVARAWAGRPSEIPRDRIVGVSAFFVTPSPLGLRLVYVEPIDVPGREGVGPSRARVGSVAAEWVLSSAVGLDAATDGFRLDSTAGPVRLSTSDMEAGPRAPGAFVLRDPAGQVLLEAEATVGDLETSRSELRRAVRDLLLAVVALLLALAALPELSRVAALRSRRAILWTTILATLTLGVAAAMWWTASTPGPARWGVFSTDAYASMRAPTLLRSPADLLLLGLLLVVVAATMTRFTYFARLAWRPRRRARADSWLSLAADVGAGAVLALVVACFELLLEDTVAGTVVDVLHPSLQPVDSARLGLLLGLLLAAAATVWIGVAVLLAAGARWGRRATGAPALALMAWTIPGVVVAGATSLPTWPYLAMLAGCVGATLPARRVRPSLRHGSQAGRMVILLGALMVPALLAYPSVLHYGIDAKRRVVETQYAEQAADQPEALLGFLTQALAEVDAFTEPAMDGVTALPLPANQPDTDQAFLIWRQTELARQRLTSAVELYGPRGALVSRFALNIPEYAAVDREHLGAACEWDVFGEVLPFGSQERNFLHAERGVCESPVGDDDGGGGNARTDGAIVVHVALDYEPRPFMTSRSPYVELLRTLPGPPLRGRVGQDVDLAMYGWDLRPLFASGQVGWPIDDTIFDRVYASREPFWARRSSGGRDYDVYFVNNRVGIYALGYPVSTIVDHLVRLAETAALVGLAFLLWIAALTCAAPFGLGHYRFGPELWREIRTSFYRRLFLAFVAIAVIPVIVLAFLIRSYFTAQLRNDVEAGAARTAVVAQRVIEELQQATDQPGVVINDDTLVFVSQVIDQDVNIFEGPQLVATSERDLFASGLLPTRTPDAVYDAIALDQAPTFVAEDRIGSLTHLVAATPIRAAGPDAILTVPLASRGQEIERQIAELDRGILLGVTLLVLLGAGSGFYMAELIADPIKRLTRATQRIARGDFDAQVAGRSADELQRLVVAFNGMAEDLKEQRGRLERTHRLEAWAEMARQVAHEIKNPLTPVQLSAEHLLRVHADRGEPLSPVLESCVASILTQVRLLRQISAEFSSYASSPRVEREPTALDQLVAEVIDPYRVGLADRVRLVVAVPPSLPVLALDRTLVGRALTNVVENALHAMPGGGALELEGTADDTQVTLTIRDAGVGLDDATLARIFEPYFSTKGSGTGLGMAIAKRNVELNGGRIAVTSRKGHGTSVAFRFPIPDAPA